jgi:hypothetical protein
MLLLAPGGQSAARGEGEGEEGMGARSGGALGGTPAAVLEMAPKEAFWKRDYQILAHVLGLRFQRLFGVLAECVPQPPIRVRWQQKLAAFNRWLTCNLTVDVNAVVEAVKAMER